MILVCLHFQYRKYLENNEDIDHIILMMNLKNILCNKLLVHLKISGYIRLSFKCHIDMSFLFCEH